MSDFERQISDALKGRASDFDPPPSLRDRVLHGTPPNGGGRWFRLRGVSGAGLFGLVALVGGGLGAGLAAGDAVDLVSDGTIVATLDPVVFYDCPDGAALGTFHRGDRVWATARDEDGGWVQLRGPQLVDVVWVDAAVVVPDESFDDLAVRDCDDTTDVLFEGETATTTATVAGATTTTTKPKKTTTTTRPAGGGGGDGEPTTTTGAPGTTTTTSGGGGGGGTTSTTQGDTTGPSITGIDASPSQIREFVEEFCPEAPTATVTVSVSDPSGIQAGSVRLSWTVDTTSGSKAMDHVSGSTYRATVGPFPDSTLTGPDPDPSPVTLRVTADDTVGNSASAQTSAELSLQRCT